MMRSAFAWVLRARRTRGMALLGLALASILAPKSAAALSECHKFGEPSYVADRTTTIDGQSVHSRFFTAGGRTREEVDRGGQIEVVITSGREYISFSPSRRIGVRRLLPGGGPKLPPGTIRSREEPDGANTRIILEGTDDSGAWTPLNEVVCSPRGELLSRRFKIPVNGRLVDNVTVQTIVSNGRIDPALFTPPADINFVR